MPSLKQIRRKSRYFIKGLENGWKLLRGERFTPPYSAPYKVEGTFDFLKLRHYCGGRELYRILGEGEKKVSDEENAPAIFLIPPLMVTAQIYDISPTLSAVNLLKEGGLDIWLADFGIPEKEPGGLKRTLEAHIIALDKAIDFVVEKTGKKVHLAGYSQGGIFAYLVTAYRESRSIHSVITFGSPVDLQKKLRPLPPDLFERLAQLFRETVGKPLDLLPGLPGTLNSIAFKLVNPRKELKYLKLMLQVLGDRDKLQKLEPTRRFLGGEGFTAWPGPALRQFIDDLMIENRIQTGGLVIRGKAFSLNQIAVPILYFVGLDDDIANPDSVKAIAKSAPEAEIYEREIHAGHLGLVVGSKAKASVWPEVIRWIQWLEGKRPPSRNLRRVNPKGEKESQELSIRESEDALQFLREELNEELEELGRELASAYDWLRWQIPRLIKLLEVSLGKNIGISKILKEQATQRPDKIFFLWGGKGYTYRQVDRRVSQIADALYRAGIKPGQHIGIFMDNHPNYLAALAALNRIGAIGVLLNPNARGEVLQQALEAGRVEGIISDPSHIEEAIITGSELPNFTLGSERKLTNSEREIPLEPLLDETLESFYPPIPNEFCKPDSTAFYIYTSGTTGKPKAAKITNRRWLFGALASAIFGKLTPSDTVYCSLPLYHASGMILAAGGSLIGGCRLALAPKFSRRNFWSDVKRTGSTVVFYIGELCRYLLSNPPTPNDKNHPVRLFIGNGLQADVWREMLRRFGPIQIVEFYGATEGNTFIVNMTGEKIGSIGRVPFGISTVELAKYDLEREEFIRDQNGYLIPSEDEEPGMLLVKISPFNPISYFDGYAEESESRKKVIRNAFKKGDAWFITGDLLKRDRDGDFWFVDRLGDTFRWKGENISTDQVREIVDRAPFVEMSAVYGIQIPGREGRAGMAAIQLKSGSEFDPKLLYQLVSENLFPPARPQFVRLVPKLELTSTFKIKKYNLQREGIDLKKISDPIFWYDEAKQTYSPLTEKNIDEVIARL